jgi:hypothetical protein
MHHIRCDGSITATSFRRGSAARQVGLQRPSPAMVQAVHGSLRATGQRRDLGWSEPGEVPQLSRGCCGRASQTGRVSPPAGAVGAARSAFPLAASRTISIARRAPWESSIALSATSRLTSGVVSTSRSPQTAWARLSVFFGEPRPFSMPSGYPFQLPHTAVWQHYSEERQLPAEMSTIVRESATEDRPMPPTYTLGWLARTPAARRPEHGRARPRGLVRFPRARCREPGRSASPRGRGNASVGVRPSLPGCRRLRTPGDIRPRRGDSAG